MAKRVVRLESIATVLPDNTPVFMALPIIRRATALHFERLNVDGALKDGPHEARLIDDDGTELPLIIYWPGLEPGLYENNLLEVISE